MKRKGKAAGLVAAIAILVSAVFGISTIAGATTPDSGPTPASYKYVKKSLLPVAKDFLKTFRHTKRPEKETVRRTTGVLSDYRKLTELTATRWTYVKGDRSPRGRASYYMQALFRGSTKPKNLVELYLAKNTEAHKYNDRGWVFGVGSTKHPGPYGIVTPRLWYVSTWIFGGGSGRFDSCPLQGSGKYNPGLSTQILDAGVREGRKMLRQAKRRSPLKRQKDVWAGMKPARAC